MDHTLGSGRGLHPTGQQFLKQLGWNPKLMPHLCEYFWAKQYFRGVNMQSAQLYSKGKQARNSPEGQAFISLTTSLEAWAVRVLKDIKG